MFLEFDGIENVRDLGGLLRVDGARTKPGLLLRAGRLQKASDRDLARLAEMGLCSVIDFRDGGELEEAPDRIVSGAAYYHLPTLPKPAQNFKPLDDPTQTPEGVLSDFRQIYLLLARSNEAAEAYGAFFRILLASEGRPVLWHCTQGKDRTGVAALLLLTALGIDMDTIFHDFMLTNRFTQTKLDAFAAMEDPPFPMDIARAIFLVYEDNLRAYVNCLEIEYGSVMNYLEMVLDVGPKEIETLESYYLE